MKADDRPRVGVVVFPGSLDDRDALPEVRRLSRPFFPDRPAAITTKWPAYAGAAHQGWPLLPEIGRAPGPPGCPKIVPRVLAEKEHTYTTGSQPLLVSSCFAPGGM